MQTECKRTDRHLGERGQVELAELVPHWL